MNVLPQGRVEPEPCGKNRLSGLRALSLLLLSLTVFWAPQLVADLASNYDCVLPGTLYRSAILSPARLESRIKQYGLRSVINLRGRQERDWYRQQVAVCERLGVRHYDVGFFAQHPMSRAVMGTLIQTLESCPKPALIHCQSGTDRTSRAAAVAVLLFDRTATLEDARRQTSFWYGCLPGSVKQRSTGAMLECYAAWLRDQRRRHDPEAFRYWARKHYDARAVAIMVHGPR
jgi:protein tyrosine phosphatase (PTP) superfamily phosphohydrolase (DUF442 family)